ncbi:MAG: hypothetical protein IKT84_01885 [Bacteroidales bacterium]|nr:hypothetical protein [Bacteroidales bacterium]
MKKFIGILAVSFLFVSCDIWSQIEQTAALQNCKFSLKNVQDVSIAGVKLKNFKNLTASDVVKLTAAIANKKIPLDLNVNVGIQNPSQQVAAINGLDWICAIDGKDFVSGAVNKKYTIPANSNISMPLAVNTDIYTLFSSGNLDALKNFISSFSGSDATSSRVAIKVKPSVYIGEQKVQFPNFITLEKVIK